MASTDESDTLIKTIKQIGTTLPLIQKIDQFIELNTLFILNKASSDKLFIVPKQTDLKAYLIRESDKLYKQVTRHDQMENMKTVLDIYKLYLRTTETLELARICDNLINELYISHESHLDMNYKMTPEEELIVHNNVINYIKINYNSGWQNKYEHSEKYDIIPSMYWGTGDFDESSPTILFMTYAELLKMLLPILYEKIKSRNTNDTSYKSELIFFTLVDSNSLNLTSLLDILKQYSDPDFTYNELIIKFMFKFAYIAHLLILKKLDIYKEELESDVTLLSTNLLPYFPFPITDPSKNCIKEMIYFLIFNNERITIKLKKFILKDLMRDVKEVDTRRGQIKGNLLAQKIKTIEEEKIRSDTKHAVWRAQHAAQMAEAKTFLREYHERTRTNALKGGKRKSKKSKSSKSNKSRKKSKSSKSNKSRKKRKLSKSNKSRKKRKSSRQSKKRSTKK